MQDGKIATRFGGCVKKSEENGIVRSNIDLKAYLDSFTGVLLYLKGGGFGSS
jgi:hypothetical protein